MPGSGRQVIESPRVDAEGHVKPRGTNACIAGHSEVFLKVDETSYANQEEQTESELASLLQKGSAFPSEVLLNIVAIRGRLRRRSRRVPHRLPV